MNDTIAALATPPAAGAIGIIRLSGAEAVATAAHVFSPYSQVPLGEAAARMMILGAVRDQAGHVLDEALAVVFRAPDSYTGEDVVELHCHGSPPVLRETLHALYEQGARPAKPGEFTKRAFLHGRMDLTQAEAVIDLITAETADAARNAAGQLGGAVRKEIEAVWQQVTDLCAHFSALVDYPEEDIDPLPEALMAELLLSASQSLAALEATYARGKMLREGVSCAIIGRPNVGKSSLLNALLGYERAIVNDRPGTTRDTLEESVHMGGVWLKVTDTAGLRETDDTIENMGVARARMAAHNAGLIFLVLDGSSPLTEEDRAVMDQIRGIPTVVLVNKSDLSQQLDHNAVEAAFLYVCSVSAVKGTGLDTLDSIVRRIFETGAAAYDGSVLTNARHADQVARASRALGEAAAAIRRGMTPDAVLGELESALTCLGEITGRCISEEIITRVFERFCVGK